ncbi:aldehyde dehydrogenase family protein [Amycolatopsis sp. NPDC054798]
MCTVSGSADRENRERGNTILLKRASICPRSAPAIEKVLREAGVPDDAYVNVFASRRQVLSLLADPRIHGVSLTGSEQAEAGWSLKRCALERLEAQLRAVLQCA